VVDLWGGVRNKLSGDPWEQGKTGRIVLGRPESSVLDLPNLLRRFRFSLDAM